MSVQACAEIVSKGDPERFATVMAAPLDARRVLFPIYAFNVEVARAPWLTEEPMIAEMRLQWWRDVLTEIREGGPIRPHEVTTPLASVLDADGAAHLDRLVAARRWDIYADPFEDEGHFDEYIASTGGGLLQAAAQALGQTSGADCAGWAVGLARFFMAIPELEARGKTPLVDGRADAVRTLAEKGLSQLTEARRAGGRGPAFYPATAAGTVLQLAAKDPRAVAEGRLHPSEFQRRASRLWVGLTGRW